MTTREQGTNAGRMVSANEARAALTGVGVEGPLSVDRFFWKRVPEQFWISVDDEYGTRALVPDADSDPADKALAVLFAAAPDLAHTVIVQAEQIAAALALHKPQYDAECGYFRCVECEAPVLEPGDRCPTVRALGVTK